jgi:hypothetical protein
MHLIILKKLKNYLWKKLKSIIIIKKLKVFLLLLAIILQYIIKGIKENTQDREAKSSPDLLEKSFTNLSHRTQ